MIQLLLYIKAVDTWYQPTQRKH